MDDCFVFVFQHGLSNASSSLTQQVQEGMRILEVNGKSLLFADKVIESVSRF